LAEFHRKKTIYHLPLNPVYPVIPSKINLGLPKMIIGFWLFDIEHWFLASEKTL
jgi:hypothetical protein